MSDDIEHGNQEIEAAKTLLDLIEEESDREEAARGLVALEREEVVHARIYQGEQAADEMATAAVGDSVGEEHVPVDDLEVTRADGVTEEVAPTEEVPGEEEEGEEASDQAENSEQEDEDGDPEEEEEQGGNNDNVTANAPATAPGPTTANTNVSGNAGTTAAATNAANALPVGQFWRVNQHRTQPLAFHVPSDAHGGTVVETLTGVIDMADREAIRQANHHRRQRVYRANVRYNLPHNRARTTDRPFTASNDQWILAEYDRYGRANNNLRIRPGELTTRYNARFPMENRTQRSIESHVQSNQALRSRRNQYRVHRR